MKTTAYIALCLTIFMAPYPTYGLGGDNATYPLKSTPVGVEICFPLPDGEKILQGIEKGEDCRDALSACEALNDSCETRAMALEDRVKEQDREIESGKKTIEDTRRAGQDAVKVAAGPWYQRALSVVKWVALGIIIGFVGGMAK